MNEERQPAASNVGQSGAQLLLVDHGEAVDAGMHEKTFEAGNACLGERLDVARIVRDDAAPCEPVDPAAILCGCALGVESGNVGRGRQTIERHVNEESVTTRGGGARSGLESFPMRAAGIVDVNMGIDEAGEKHGITKIFARDFRRDFTGRDDVADAAVFDKKRGGAHATRGHDTAREVSA